MAQVDRRTFERLKGIGEGAAEGFRTGGAGIPDGAAWKAGSGLGHTLGRLRLGEVPRGMLVAVVLLAFLAVALGAVLIGSQPKGVLLTREEGAQEVGQEAGASAGEGDTGPGEKVVQEGAGSQEAGGEPSLWVHVAGAVCNPGVYALQEGARVVDAVEAAGGFASDADPDALNLAQPVADGIKVSVPYVGQVAAGDAALAETGASGTGTVGGLVNINVADASLLQTLPGVGESIAAEIVRDREANGPFSSPEDLMRVSGIGEKKYEALSALVTA